MSDREALDGLKAFGELLGMLKESANNLAVIVKVMEGAASGKDATAYFVALEKITECDSDDLATMLIVAVSLLAQLKVKVNQDDRYDDLRELLGMKKLAAQPEETDAV